MDHDGARSDASIDAPVEDSQPPDVLDASMSADVAADGWCTGDAEPHGVPYCYLDAATWCCLPQGETVPTCPPGAGDYDVLPCHYDGGCYACSPGGGTQGSSLTCVCGGPPDDAGSPTWECAGAGSECTQ